MARRLLGPAIAVLLCGALLAPSTAAAAKKPLRSEAIMHGLDYLHANQRTGGGFAPNGTASSAIDTPWVMLAISAAKEAPELWRANGGDPVAYLQTQNLVAVAESDSEEVNAPVYYAQCILAFVASGKPNTVYQAGTPRVNLVDKLNAYRPVSDNYYSPGGGKSKVSTTAWAILALSAAEQEYADWSSSVTWLQNQPNGDGGFGVDSGGTSKVDATSVAILALIAGRRSADNPVVVDAIAYIKGRQHDNGGFGNSATDERSYAEPTSWAMQALCSCGIDPESLNGGTNGRTPATYLKSLQTKRGSFSWTNNRPGDNPLRTTAVALVGRCATIKRHLPFHGLAPSDERYKPRWLPEFKSFTPHNKATFKVSTVVITATYADNPGGTGIKTAAVRLKVDGNDKTRPAAISSSRLSLKLTGLTNGSHTVEIKLGDWAGNTRTSTHTFTVNKSSPSPSPTPSSTPSSTPTTIRPPATTIKPPPTTILPPTTMSPTTTYSPGPTDTGNPWLSPSPSPSTSGSPVPGGTSGDGGWGPTILGIVLVSLVPIGATASYLARRRTSGRLDGAAHGKMLAGGGSAWQRLRGRFGRGGQTPPATVDE